MNIQLGNLGILFGLSALAVPIVLHLLQRRRFDPRDWGAMQFLPDTIAVERKRWLDEIALMLLRMAMIALIVMALATPTSVGSWLGDQGGREGVIVLDGSYSMDVRIPDRPTPWQEAIRWARDYENQTDRVTVIVGRHPPMIVPAQRIDELPRGNADMPGALAEAWKHLQRSKASTKEIIVLTDGQKHGWADSATLAAFERLGSQWRDAPPTLRIVKVGADLPASLPNFALAPLTVSRGVAKVKQEIAFQSALHLNGFDKYLRPRSVKVFIDGKETKTLDLPASTALKQGQIPLSFALRFDKEGRYDVSLFVDADPVHDVLPGDNEQHTVVDVVKELPILLVDGDRLLSVQCSTFFLHGALGAKQIAYSSWKPNDAEQAAVIVLADVPHLDTAQLEALERFLADGGGVLILAGERVADAKAFYNKHLYRDGRGWLPARLSEVAASNDAVTPDPRSFLHPALEMFRTSPEGSMSGVRFSKWWKTSLDAKSWATPIGKLSNDDPFLLEKAYKQGRVILCTVPPDRHWGSTLSNVWQYPILMHELVYYLAGNRNVASTLKVVRPDLRESNLTRCTEDDWKMVHARLQTPTSARDGESGSKDLWWLILLGVIGLLCSEVWMTRRMALARGR